MQTIFNFLLEIITRLENLIDSGVLIYKLSCGNIVSLEPSWMLCLFGQGILGFQTVMTTLNVLLIYILLLWVFAVP